MERQNRFQEMQKWEVQFQCEIMARQLKSEKKDSAHDLAHIGRVVQTAKKLCLEEGALWEVVVPSAWLHDFVIIAKNDPRRSEASRISAQAAIEYLVQINYPTEFLSSIHAAIQSHSFSAQLECPTLEAKIVQDADRLDALGAIGIARLFSTAGIMESSYYHESDPFGKSRPLDDRKYALDHFYLKLFKISETLKTSAGKKEGTRRIQFMKAYLSQLEQELEGLH